MRSVAVACLLAVSGILFTGCVSINRRLDVPAVSRIDVGRTTTDEVAKIFGLPSQTVIGPKEMAVARYYFREFRVANDVRAYERHEHPGDVLFRTLSLRYGPNRIIEEKVHDESVTPVYRYNGWLVAGPSLMPENLNFIQKDATTKSDLIANLGEPTSQSVDVHGAPTLVWISAKLRSDRLADAEIRQLVVLLNERKTVKDYAVFLHDMPGVRGNWR